MTREEFFKGWVLLTTQPWGARYGDNSMIARTQIELYFDAFKSYPADMWLDKCRAAASTCEFWPSIAKLRAAWDVRNAINHPQPEEAWSIAQGALDEYGSVVWTPMIREAFFAGAFQLRDNPIQARMAFLEKYKQLLESGASAEPEWELSPGFDRQGRVDAIKLAAVKRRITSTTAQRLIDQQGLTPEEREEANALLSSVLGDGPKRIGN